ncbi:SGNH/GDSL hydrolase family protein [Klebsiella sp. BIGb0407]|uniref:SGNH/GDSL hydrolase family protein n=1 Tax=Klebsiella sp. BIGb0407 TaxID=2940603 RepID=UPI002168F111|nr:SGNH/GDSL hydrolase family protein [Klebsiella sp. BIGb0407]MCS3433745.1 secreted effector protein SseJ [Klebsiella sp. BIGb0407]
MISINGPALLAVQALNVVVKAPALHVLSPLLKIATIKSSNAELLQKNKFIEKMNISIDKSDPIQVDLAAKFKRTIKDFQLNPKSITDKYNIVREGGDVLAENTNFKLAKAIGKLYPHPDVTLDNIDRLVVFGDSLSDSNGRMFDKSLHIFPSYNQYYEGRFTNGFVWGEYLSSPAFLNKKMVNFAEGGSTSASYSPLNLRSNFLSNLDSQIKEYQPSARDLTVLFAGANDYIVLHKNDVLKVVETQIDDVEKLLKSGVKNILVMGMPDISLTPESEHSGHKREYEDISIAHNVLLQKNIEKLKVKYPAAKIFFFDTSAALKEIITIARQIGYDTTHSYTTHGYIHNPLETDPDLNISPEYLYNDGVHPTQEVHQTFATILNSFIVKNYSDKAAAA